MICMSNSLSVRAMARESDGSDHSSHRAQKPFVSTPAKP